VWAIDDWTGNGSDGGIWLTIGTWGTWETNGSGGGIAGSKLGGGFEKSSKN